MLRKDPRSDSELLQIVWDYMSDETPLQQADVIIVGGCSDTGLAHYAAELYHMGFAPYIVFSGYQAPGMDTTEADLLAQAARNLSVPDSAIFREQTASNTGENITRTITLLEEKGIAAKRVILIHKPYMSRRFLATAQAQWPEPQPMFISRHENISLTEYTLKHGHGEVIRRVLGDFSRMAKYAKKGFQAHHDIPESVQEAFDIMADRNHQIR
jgi:uncharacterized SAM-binding protein YcdF (DUF218 family)